MFQIWLCSKLWVHVGLIDASPLHSRSTFRAVSIAVALAFISWCQQLHLRYVDMVLFCNDAQCQNIEFLHVSGLALRGIVYLKRPYIPLGRKGDIQPNIVFLAQVSLITCFSLEVEFQFLTTQRILQCMLKDVAPSSNTGNEWEVIKAP